RSDRILSESYLISYQEPVVSSQEAKGRRQKAGGKRQEAKGKRQEAKGKRQKAALFFPHPTPHSPDHPQDSDGELN
ncbi:MAG: hypothetical protein PX638_16670, partial [Microcystis sp. M53599_WE4]|nr:hypothetical protein [Microcystis sp. M53599_WE4]